VHFRVLIIGKIRERYIRLAIDDFVKRLKPFHHIEEVELRAADGSDPRRAVLADSLRLMDNVSRSERLWLLDREGIQLTSEQLASSIGDEETQGHQQITFAIGGAYGFNELVRERANIRWSFSKLTFLHEWSRAILFEQLYRATKIRRGEPYHH
jgi:23S rRNA (pseudouridine1915-N3)-methyltransferase